jgi:DNA transposition AAA+ family ATPase
VTNAYSYANSLSTDLTGVKIVVVDTDGYLALIEHLTINLDVFITEGDTGAETVEDVVTDMIATNIMVVFEQNPDLHSSVRFKLLKETDAVVDDLSEVLAGVWTKKATNEQIAFLDEYIALVKNLFDSAVAIYD